MGTDQLGGAPGRGHVVVAADKFKGSLSAAQVAEHVAAGLARVRPGIRVVAAPAADGGEGTVDAAVAGGYARIPAEVSGPTGEPVAASYALSGGTAVIEMAQASGLSRLPGGLPAPLAASSAGTGELIAAAIGRGARRIVLGLGGSACTDGGAGMVRALGVRLADADGRELAEGGAALGRLHAVDLEGLRLPPGLEFVVAGDVDNPLLGPQGAAAVYAPQKGADPGQVRVLEEGLSRWASAAERALGRSVREEPGAGAAGGTGFAALAFLHARIRPGIALLLDLTGFAARAEGAALVVTGEGSLDAQTLRGKAPAGVAAAAKAAGIPVVAVCGRLALTASQLRGAGIAKAYPLMELAPGEEAAMSRAGPLLQAAAEQIAADYL